MSLVAQRGINRPLDFNCLSILSLLYLYRISTNLYRISTVSLLCLYESLPVSSFNKLNKPYSSLSYLYQSLPVSKYSPLHLHQSLLISLVSPSIPKLTKLYELNTTPVFVT